MTSCCCRFGAAVSGEWPEFPCEDCPRHRAEFMKDGSRCRRHPTEDSTTPEQEVAYLLWQVNEGYIAAEDRAIGTNWFLTPVGPQHPEDEAERSHWLSLAREVITIVEAAQSGRIEQPGESR